jgi:F-type H+-transporting ATPase subunit b
MINLDITFFIQLVNFLIVLTVLNLILYRPIRGILKKRAQEMSERLAAVEGFADQADAKMASYRESLSQARQDAQGVRVTFREEGVTREKEIVEQASEEAGVKLAAAKETIATEKQAAMDALKGEVTRFAKEASKKILSKA